MIASLVLAGAVSLPALSLAEGNGGGSAALRSDPPASAAPPQGEPPDQGEPQDGRRGAADGSGPGGPPGEGDPASSPGETPLDAAPEAGGPDLAAAERRSREATARKSASRTVSMGDNFFSPRTVSVSVGDSVTWVNKGQAPHSATADNGSFDTGVFNSPGRRSATFSRAGTFAYFCSVHPGMRGTVRVSSSGGGDGGGSGGGSGAGSAASESSAVASPGAAASGSSLASTGSDARAVFAAGAMLLLTGLWIRRRVASEPH